jgi:CcmD family protein
MENFGYLLAAFIIIWVAVFAYVFSLSQKQKRLRREIDQLKATLQEQKKA